MNITRSLLFVPLLAALAFAQAGDRGNSNQPEVWKNMKVPPGDVVPADKALSTFKIAPGFKLELVAAEPLVEDPVAIAWDADGRLWAVEMRGYMPDVDGKGEDVRNGQIVILEDVNGDGKMDKSTVFLDGLQMPRAIAIVQGGVLVSEPPILWYCRDTDGDGKADVKIEAYKGYARQGPVEHTENGLMRGLDGWLYNAKSSRRLRVTLEDDQPKLEFEESTGRGQWGITQDNYGRLYHNSNSSYLSMDTTPSEYLRRNPHYEIKSNSRGVASDQSVWSIRVNPGINRGYQGPMLREDGRLARTTATCGPGIYRGDQYPREYVGNAFIPEPSGNVVSHFMHEEQSDGSVRMKHTAYEDPQWEKREFLASTDERFRPVNAYTGPDGCMYIVDMYRGILQHRVYVTTFLRKQILERGLDKPIGLGRIYRMVYEGASPQKPTMRENATRPMLSKASSADLVKTLAHPNGWHRDTAQRLLIERNDASVAGDIADMATSHKDHLARLHALYTLAGMDYLDYFTLSMAVEDEHPKVRTVALRVSEDLLNAVVKGAEEQDQQDLLNAVLANMKEKNPEILRQLAFTLGGAKAPRVGDAVRQLLLTHGNKNEIREAVLTGLYQRELEFLQRLLAEEAWTKKTREAEQLIKDLTTCVITEYQPARIARLLDLAADQQGNAAWRGQVIIDTMVEVFTPRGGKRGPKPIYYETQPKAMLTLAAHKDKAIQAGTKKLAEYIKFGAPPPPAVPVTPLTAGQQKLFDTGKVLYSQTCAACHQLSGLGEEGKAPPLLDSPFLLGDPQRTVRIVLQGVTGPITVHGRTYNMDMPPLKGFTDEQIAAILTYARREWEHAGDPIEPATVTQIREATKNRDAAWTEKELLKIK